MGLCSSKKGNSTGAPKHQSKVERKKQTMINAQLMEAHRKDEQIIKMLFLGTGESGKTTVFKQMRMLYGKDDPAPDSPDDARIAISENIINGTKAVLHANSKLEGMKPLSSKAAKAAAITVREVGLDMELTPEVAKAINVLWADKGFKFTWSQRAKFQVLDNYDAFAESLRAYPAWGGPKWVPSLVDTMKARVRTSGIVQHDLVIENAKFMIVDVGGQRNERRKWVHCFENVTAVVFMVAINEYDQKLFEDKDMNRLVEAVDLFSEIANSVWFKNASIILFLNKIDLFKQKLCKDKVPLNVSGLFPDAPKGYDYNKAGKWFKTKFEGLTKARVYTHLTCALDTDFMATVFRSAVHGILEQLIQGSGLGRMDR